MTKLAQLVEGMASALQVPPSRVRTAAAQLRRHKLIQTGPRGPGAPEMSPTDAANLLLAVMYDGELADAHETVPRMRQATVRYFEGRRSFEAGGAKLNRLPRNGFITSAEGDGHDLGTVLEILLDWWVRYGSVHEDCASEDDEEFDLEVVNLRLEVSCPGYRARITFNSPMGLFWRIDYEWKSPDQIAYESQTDGSLVKARWEARAGPHLWSSREVGEDCLTIIAEVLRGSDWEDAFTEFVPPYDGQSVHAQEAEYA